jgi:hypothetical protein
LNHTPSFEPSPLRRNLASVYNDRPLEDRKHKMLRLISQMKQEERCLLGFNRRIPAQITGKSADTSDLLVCAIGLSPVVELAVRSMKQRPVALGERGTGAE